METNIFIAAAKSSSGLVQVPADVCRWSRASCLGPGRGKWLQVRLSSDRVQSQICKFIFVLTYIYQWAIIK